MVEAVTAVGLTAAWLYIVGLSALRQLAVSLAGRSGNLRRPDRTTFGRLLLIEPFDRLLERLRVYEALSVQLDGYHMKLFVLKGRAWTFDMTKRDIASSVGFGYAALTGSAWLAWLGGEPLLLPVGGFAAAALSCRGYADAGRKLERRRKLIVSALPEMMSRLMLLVGAGETVQRAFVRCMRGKEESEHPLDREWRTAAAELHNGQSFAQALERFNRSCAVQEVSVFTTVMLLNYRRGGEHFVLAVRELSYALWEKRKSIARASGEEASSKLVFPLVGILLVMMVLVAAPAFLLMG